MASDKSTNFIKRNRPPRVSISYEDPYDSEKMVELPFVMGVMADLSGNASEVEKPAMEDRDFADVTSASLDDYMKSVAPGLSFNVENKMGGEDRLGISLQFEKMADLSPAEIARQIPALKKLLEARQHLANLQRYMNSKPKAQDQIRKLLNDPELLAALLEREDQGVVQEEGE
ncbi:MAG: type VI secretion system contractile sheath small subunit [Paracoccus sp. (in: a-proteobacteria)]|uniref:type VI secretion system contractile sheath small subunit n=1 Tax=Paracoccus sp. TaxID=267 RepID=UPI0026DFAA92|nr:type VI secretion system contractile sheath small subunit [Paracoccus sp. (in: a-proteobacteria)]MDO5622767.1 type VI secretion system contractile sheath small subunit [Paracoccus sp. (in: a-proteobacteria)]